MNQFSPIPSLPPAPPAPPARRRRAGKRKRRPARPLGMALWQWLVLLALSGCVLAAGLSLARANNAMRALEAERESRRLAQEAEIRRHQVKYRDLIEYYAAVNRIDPAYVAAVIKRESDYDPSAVSRVNAKGLMQIMPDTGEWLAGKVKLGNYTADMLFDPETNIKMGTWYLGYLCREFDGDPVMIACAYHAGQGNVRAWLKKYSSDGKRLTVNEIPMDDTRYYAGKVLNAYAIYQQHYY